jgi:hypothetical protein
MNNIAVHTRWKPNKLEEQHLKQHRELIREMLTIIWKHDLYLNIEKCQFKQAKVDYLEVWVGGKHISIKEAKVKKVKD